MQHEYLPVVFKLFILTLQLAIYTTYTITSHFISNKSTCACHHLKTQINNNKRLKIFKVIYDLF